MRQLVRAHAYWRLKGLVADLVVWNEDTSGYRQELHEQIMSSDRLSGDGSLVDKPGGIFVRRADQMSEDDRVLMQTVARVIVVDTDGPLPNRSTAAGASSSPPLLAGRRPSARRSSRSRPLPPTATSGSA